MTFDALGYGRVKAYSKGEEEEIEDISLQNWLKEKTRTKEEKSIIPIEDFMRVFLAVRMYNKVKVRVKHHKILRIEVPYIIPKSVRMGEDEIDYSKIYKMKKGGIFFGNWHLRVNKDEVVWSTTFNLNGTEESFSVTTIISKD